MSGATLKGDLTSPPADRIKSPISSLNKNHSKATDRYTPNAVSSAGSHKPSDVCQHGLQTTAERLAVVTGSQAHH